jgi:hypothetical protein
MTKIHNIKNTGTVATLALAIALISSPASASVQYNFTAGANSLSSGANVSGHTFSSLGSGDSGPNVTVNGWSNTVGSSNLDIESATVHTWSGLGVTNRDESTTSPNHSTDNSNGRYDSVLFSFASDISLDGLSIGWKYYDSDMTVLAYTGAAPFDTSTKLAGLQYDELVSNGWEIIDHLSNVALDYSPSSTGDTITSFNSGGVSASYWLVGAYNPLVGNSPGWTTGNDYVKISALTGSTPTKHNGGGTVPEPSSLLLLALGLGSLWHFRRRGAALRQEGDVLAC